MKCHIALDLSEQENPVIVMTVDGETSTYVRQSPKEEPQPRLRTKRDKRENNKLSKASKPQPSTSMKPIPGRFVVGCGNKEHCMFDENDRVESMDGSERLLGTYDDGDDGSELAKFLNPVVREGKDEFCIVRSGERAGRTGRLICVFTRERNGSPVAYCLMEGDDGERFTESAKFVDMKR